MYNNHKYARAIEALESAICEAEEEHEKLNKRFSYRLSETEIKEHDELISEYKEAIIALQMVASGKLRVI